MGGWWLGLGVALAVVGGSWSVGWETVVGSKGAETSKGLESCGLTGRGVEVVEEGGVRDVAGWVRVVAMVDLSWTNSSLLSAKLPRACRQRPENRLTTLCVALKKDKERAADNVRRAQHLYSPTPVDGGAHKTGEEGRGTRGREKRQILAAAAVGASGLAGYLISKVAGDSQSSDVHSALKRLQDGQDSVYSHLQDLGRELTVFTRITHHTGENLRQLEREMVELEDEFPRATAKVAAEEELLMALADIELHRLNVEMVKEEVAQHAFLAAQRYEGIVDGHAHRLSPGLLPPDLFRQRLRHIQDQLNEEKFSEVGKISFGESAEEAYAGTEVDYVDLVNVLHPDNVTRAAARLVFRTPYMAAGSAKSRLFSLRAFPYLANFTTDAKGAKTKDFLQVKLQAPYVAVREGGNVEDGEYFQLIQAEDLQDLGNRTFINTQPGAFLFSKTEPSCEYRSARGLGDGGKGDGDGGTGGGGLCLLNSRPVRGFRSFYDLRSGCWLLHERQDFKLREECDGHVNWPKLGSLALFKPRCGCSYSMSEPERELPASWASCAEAQASIVLLPSVGAEELARLLAPLSHLLHGGPGALPGPAAWVPVGRDGEGEGQRRAKRSTSWAGLSREEQLGRLKARLEREPEWLLKRTLGKMVLERQVEVGRAAEEGREGKVWAPKVLHKAVLYAAIAAVALVGLALLLRATCHSTKPKPIA